MTFTNKDKMLARKYREAGYKWIARDKQNSLYICLYKPTKFALSNYAWICLYSKRIDKRNFKPVQFSDSEPTSTLCRLLCLIIPTLFNTATHFKLEKKIGV